ncbi:MAG TPA: neutral zinc metallopeptidase, partial [Longimicrobium sp.]|nr:neutral zinc metallopeptidase [Longimicrobium sp.]
MRWQGRGGSGNIEDRRGMGGGGMAAGGGIGAVVIGLIYFLLTGDPSGVQVPAGGGQAERPAQSGPVDPARDTLGQFVSTILRDTEITWGQLFQQAGETYQEPRLVLFENSVQSACGGASTAVGPFYCPGDQKVYIDLAFYEQMRRQLDAPGDFAQAYVIAHEVGHHIQTLTGVSQQVNSASQRVSREEANQLSVMQELQADCYAGVWAHHAEARQPWLEPGDVEEALNAASAIGDDTLQKKQQGHVQPESFTHGT